VASLATLLANALPRMNVTAVVGMTTLLQTVLAEKRPATYAARSDISSQNVVKHLVMAVGGAVVGKTAMPVGALTIWWLTARTAKKPAASAARSDI